jgi:hypothetical protein
VRLVRVITGVGVLWLVALHAILFFERVSDGSIARPDVALRWLATAGVIAALVAIRRFRPALQFGRGSLIALWILVAVMHAAIPASDRIITSSDEWIALAQNAASGLVTILAIGLATTAVSNLRHTNTGLLNIFTQPVLHAASSPSAPRAPPAL